MLQKEGDEPPQCCLCPVTGGALKQTVEPGLWCHCACMQWIPEVTVDNLARMEPISHIRSIQKERWDLNCSVCKYAHHLFSLSFISPNIYSILDFFYPSVCVSIYPCLPLTAVRPNLIVWIKSSKFPCCEIVLFSPNSHHPDLVFILRFVSKKRPL